MFKLFSEQKAADELVRAFPDLLDPESLPALHLGGIWLARPDGYVAAAVSEDEVSLIASYLAGLR